MDITFSAKETKTDELDVKKSNFSFIYMVAIANTNPELWKQFKNVIANIDNYILEEQPSLQEKDTKGDKTPSSIN